MSVSNVTGVGRVVLPATGSRTPETPSTSSQGEGTSTSASIVTVDEKTNQPVAPRFPWLSRLQRELEPVSRQPSPYGSVPILGEKLDKQA
jgi:hypothetical protein